jgi:hypothetical protein
MGAVFLNLQHIGGVDEGAIALLEKSWDAALPARCWGVLEVPGGLLAARGRSKGVAGNQGGVREEKQQYENALTAS